LPPVPAGGALELTVTGIPARDRTGRDVAFGLCVLLLGAALAGLYRTGRATRAAPAGSGRDELIARREKLFADLVAVERERKGGADAPRLADRRQQLINELETVYRSLARLEEQVGARRVLSEADGLWVFVVRDLERHLIPPDHLLSSFSAHL